MSHDLPDDWYEEHDGQRLVLNSEKVATGIAAAVAAERERCAKAAGNRLKAISDGIRGPKNYIPATIIAEVEAAVRLAPHPADAGQASS